MHSKAQRNKLNLGVFGSVIAAFVMVRTIQGKQNVQLVKNNSSGTRHKQTAQQTEQVAEKQEA